MADEIEKKETETAAQAEEIKQEAETKEEPVAVAEAETKEVKAPAGKIKNTMADVEAMLLAEQSNDGKFPEFNIGDTVRIGVKIREGNKERVQPYEGVVIAFKHGGPRKSFIVRRISYEVAIERVFPFHSPYIESIEVVRRGRVRRAKLYYLRGRYGRAAKITEKVGTKKTVKAGTAATAKTETKKTVKAETKKTEKK